jgi:ribosomal protein L16 Arg81 hydroxylase
MCPAFSLVLTRIAFHYSLEADSSRERMVSTQQATVNLPKHLGFEELIAPLCVKEFHNVFWQKRPCHVHGVESKFRELFSWKDLNDLLESHHFAHPRLRLSKDGADVAPKQYMETLRFTKGNRADSWGLTREFADGASLILQHADEFHPGLQLLVDALTSALGWHAEVEVIAGLGSSNALPIHVDSNDCLVFQIEGTKRWRLYEPTRTAPLRASKMFPDRYDVLPAINPDSERPTITFEVTAGDFAYIPRGWWHLVEPLPGPCLSLNPTVYTPTIQDLLRWLVNELSIEEICRFAIPTDAHEQQSVLCRVADVVNRALVPDAVSTFRRFVVNEMEGKPSISLPASAMGRQQVSLSRSVTIDGGGSVHVTSDNDSAIFRVRWRGRDFHFERQHLEVFRGLNDGQSHCVSDLLAGCSSAEARIRTIAFLSTLQREGIIMVIP